MGFFRRVAGLLGLAKDESHEEKGEDEEGRYAHARADADNLNRVTASANFASLPHKGFSVPVQVPVERAQPRPVIVPRNVGDGGVQGFKWYARRLRIDADGDVADEFLNEVVREELNDTPVEAGKHLPSFEVNYSTRPAKVRSQVLSADGKIQQSVEYQGRLMWV